MTSVAHPQGAAVALAVALSLGTGQASAADLSPRTAPGQDLAHLSLETAPIHDNNLARLSLQTAPADPPPAGERDLAYDLGVQAEATGDHPRAAAAFERAYRLTSPAETGPRLLFLRAAVAARLRADDGTPATRVHLCHAQAVLRDYLGDAPATLTSEEQQSLATLDERLADATPDCQTLLNPPPPPVDPPAPTPPPAAPPKPAPTPPTPPPSVRRTPTERGLLIGGVTSLGLGVASFAVMGAGLDFGVRARDEGFELCREGVNSCTAFEVTVYERRERGEFGNTLARTGAAVGVITLVAGVALVVAGERLRLRRRAAVARHLTPHLAPGLAGLGLAGRF